MEQYKKDCVADTSSLIALARGEAIDCLGEIFRKVYIPQAVKEECKDSKTLVAIQKSFFEVKKVNNILPINVHRGELEAISLAVELGVHLILVDDKKAFAKAMEYNLSSIAVPEILVLAKYKGIIKSVKAVFDTMRANNEGIEETIYFETLEEAGEL